MFPSAGDTAPSDVLNEPHSQPTRLLLMADGQDVLQKPQLAPASSDASDPKATDQLWVNPAPPLPKGSYRPEKALDDISATAYALHAFLRSHMVESEAYLTEYDPKM